MEGCCVATEPRSRCEGLAYTGFGISLSALSALSKTYWNQGRWKEAEELEVLVMETSSRVLGEEHPDTLLSMANLAHTINVQTHKDTAMRLMTDVVEYRTDNIGAAYPDTVDSASTLDAWNSNQI